MTVHNIDSAGPPVGPPRLGRLGRRVARCGVLLQKFNAAPRIPDPPRPAPLSAGPSGGRGGAGRAVRRGKRLSRPPGAGRGRTRAARRQTRGRGGMATLGGEKSSSYWSQSCSLFRFDKVNSPRKVEAARSPLPLPGGREARLLPHPRLAPGWPGTALAGQAVARAQQAVGLK